MTGLERKLFLLCGRQTKPKKEARFGAAHTLGHSLWSFKPSSFSKTTKRKGRLILSFYPFGKYGQKKISAQTQKENPVMRRCHISIYKTLMNSLYGRFGINPRSTITEVCLEYRYNYLIRNSELIFIEKLNELYYVISYWDNPGNNCWKGDPSERWNPPRISAIQLAAAITASARIYMYPFISREDCYYTDTDSVVLGQPLPEEWISSSTLGKFKLEHKDTS